MAREKARSEQDRIFSELDATQRRAIIRAVNRGRAVDNRRHAKLAVAIAQRQLRFWRWAWLIGPVVGLVQLPFSTPLTAVSNGILGTLMLLFMSWFWTRRARRAEAANLEVVRNGPSRPSRHTPATKDRVTTSAAPDGRTPHDRDAGDGDAAESDESQPSRRADSHLPAPRPASPRGKKRRS